MIAEAHKSLVAVLQHNSVRSLLIKREAFDTRWYYGTKSVVYEKR